MSVLVANNFMFKAQDYQGLACRKHVDLLLCNPSIVLLGSLSFPGEHGEEGGGRNLRDGQEVQLQTHEGDHQTTGELHASASLNF